MFEPETIGRAIVVVTGIILIYFLVKQALTLRAKTNALKIKLTID